ncbi:hypothetical protein A79_0371 [Vibrio parahaemolyticus AQ3810]|nr:hypothetical protein A79_0371 [Vibrio parahaemolyticus AQ3810]
MASQIKRFADWCELRDERKARIVPDEETRKSQGDRLGFLLSVDGE